MSKLKIVPAELWKAMEKYLDEPGVVLVPETALSSFTDDEASRLTEMDGQKVDYDFGGEPDICIDIIHDRSSFAAAAVLELDN